MHSTKWTGWEQHLVVQAQAGNTVAFELLADEHRDSMRGLAMRMLRDPEDANDAVQDALVKAFRAIHQFQPGRPVLPWLLRICSNCCVDIMRHKKATPESLEKHEFALTDDSVDVSDSAETGMRSELVHAAVNRLPERYRDIITMRHFRHMEVCEIAMALNKPEGTIKSWLFRARARLRRDLQIALG